jgi:hypothetical protein
VSMSEMEKIIVGVPKWWVRSHCRMCGGFLKDDKKGNLTEFTLMDNSRVQGYLCHKCATSQKIAKLR